jgi:glycosyltransferase involved in cell wall biosynthesis
MVAAVKVMHITTVDLSLKFLVRPQLLSIVQLGGEAVGVSAPGPWVADLRTDGIKHVALDASTRGAAPLKDLRAALQFLRILRTERPDVLHTHNPKPGLYGRILGRMTRVPIVVNTVHGLYATPDDRFLKKALVYALEAFAARFSDAELVQSSEDLALLNKWHIAPQGKARLLGNGVDLQRFNPDRPDGQSRQALRAELGIADGQIVVGIVGRLVEEKGFVELFTAASCLDSQYQLVVVGPTDAAKGDALTPGVIATARASGVRFLGMRTDVDELYRAMDIFVLPSHREGFPRAAMEAAAMGLPVVASDIRGCREVVEHGVNGLLFPVRDAVALEAAIRKLGEDGEARARMGEAGRRKAQASFDEDQVVAIVVDTYRRLAHRKGLSRLAAQLSGPADTLPGDRPSA